MKLFLISLIKKPRRLILLLSVILAALIGAYTLIGRHQHALEPIPPGSLHYIPGPGGENDAIQLEKQNYQINRSGHHDH